MKNINEVLSNLNEFCSPRVLSSVDDSYVKIARVIGELPMHKHVSDELFIIHRGEMVMEIEGELIPLKEGDVYLVEAGKMHRPIAKEECQCILVEKKEVKHTGEETFDITRSIDEQLK